MPLGGSVTYGVGSTDGNGFRKHLLDMLLSNNFEIRMVGSRNCGSMNNNDNEGWRGYRLDQIHNKAKQSIQALLPNIFVINAGSNDCIQDYKLDSFMERMSNLLDYLWLASPRSTAILSTLLVNSNKEIDSRVIGSGRYEDLGWLWILLVRRVHWLLRQNCGGSHLSSSRSAAIYGGLKKEFWRVGYVRSNENQYYSNNP
jgi:hypothetical protein